MAAELIEMAREVGGEELVERIERLQDEIKEVKQQIETDIDEDQKLEQQLIKEGDFSESAVEDMSLQTKLEIAEATGLREETVNTWIPVAGRRNEESDEEEEEVTINRPTPRTYTKEVPIEVVRIRSLSPSSTRNKVHRLKQSMNSTAGSIERGPKRPVATNSEQLNAGRSR